MASTIKSSLIWIFTVGFLFFLTSDALAVSYYRPPPVKPENARMPELSLWKSDFTSRDKWMIFDKNYLQGANLTSGDVDGDGSDEVIAGSGPGYAPEVRIYSSAGALKTQFKVFKPSFLGGVRVAAGDFNSDGKAEIVVAPGAGYEPLINIYDGAGKPLNKNGVNVYKNSFTGGVHVLAVDIDNDGRSEIVTTPGPSGGPHVRFFDHELNNLGQDFFPFNDDMRDGLSMAALRTPVGMVLAFAPESWSSPEVRLYTVLGGVKYLWFFQAAEATSRHGVVLSSFDKDGDGHDELIFAPNGGASPEVKIFSWLGNLLGKYLLHDPDYRGSLSFTQLDADRDGLKELVSVNTAPVVVGPLDKEKFIDVSIKEQRLYAYERGRLVNNFLISSGTYKYPTPLVDTVVKEKIPKKTYKWTYGIDHPDNYDLKNVKNNLRIYGNIYIHNAYWHRNFGRRMSHGCINVGLDDSDWIYRWADVGTVVKTRL